MILNKLSTINSLYPIILSKNKWMFLLFNIHRKIVLASKSPRRRQILDQIGLHFEVIVSDFEEDLDKTAYTPVFNSQFKNSSSFLF